MKSLPLSLAVKDLRHDWLSSLCFIAALVGVLAPLLILFALKNGVIGSMIDRLVENPSNRELIAVGAGSHTPEFFEMLRARNDVTFVMPATRSINTSANAVRNVEDRKLERSVTLVPSTVGDPLIAQGSVSRGNVFLSQKLASSLNLEIGGTLEMIIGREIDGQSETVRAPLNVVGIVPETLFSRAAVFISLPDLLAIERFRDDKTLAAENWRDPAPDPATYASFRLYAAQLQDLANLEDDLASQGIRTRPRAQNASLLLRFRENLNLLYFAIASIAGIGFWAANTANLRGVVERQRITFSLLDLLGLSKLQRRLIPIFQSIILVLLGIFATLVLVVPAIWIINMFFQSNDGGVITRLEPAHIGATFLLGLFTAITASVWATIAIGHIKPQEVLTHA